MRARKAAPVRLPRAGADIAKSTQHRLVNIGCERSSFPLLFGLDYHATVEPLEKFCTPETQAKYPAMKAGEHLMRMTVNAFRYMADAKEKGALVPEYEVPEQNPFKREARVQGATDAPAS